jgi:hypothetical protein
MNTVRGVGGRFLLVPLRRAATALALMAIGEQQCPQPRSPSLCYGLRCSPPHSAGLPVALAAHPARWVQLRKRGQRSSNTIKAMEFSNDTNQTTHLPSFSRISRLHKSDRGWNLGEVT